MRRKLYPALAFALVCALAVAGLYFWRVDERSAGVEDEGPRDEEAGGEVSVPEESPIETPPAEAGRPEMDFTGTSLVARHLGRKQWEVEVGRVEVHRSKGYVNLYDIENGRIYRDGRAVLVFRAPVGVWYVNSNDVELSGGVRVGFRGEDGSSGEFQSDRLFWNASAQSLVARDGARLEFDGNRLEAEVIEYRLETGTVIASGGAAVELKDGTSVNADKLTYDLRTGLVEAAGKGRMKIIRRK